MDVFDNAAPVAGERLSALAELHGSSSICHLAAGGVTHDAMLATGELTIEEFADDLARLDDEDFAWRSPILSMAWGPRPETVE